MIEKLKSCWQDVAVIAVFLAIGLAYFITPISQGLVLTGHDSTGGIGMGRELSEYHERTGERTRWTNSVFGGMPTYQVAPSYDSNTSLGQISKIYRLGTTGEMSYIFLYLLGFYILLRAFNFKPYLAALGAILWAFSSYFLIIIAAGHIWKVLTLCYIPPTIAGLVLCYRGKLLWGGAVTGLFTAFQIMSNHPQMSYYFFFVMLAIVVAYGVASFLPRQAATDDYGARLTPAAWAKATAVIALAGAIGVAANLPNLYHTYEYTKHSTRGGSELTAAGNAGKTNNNAGLDTDYITQWSYGIDESLTLMIPDFKGGGSGSILERDGAENLDGYTEFYDCAAQLQQMAAANGQQITPPGLNQYWGEQPFTVGPVYIGALVCFLFVLGIFFVRGPMKWALLAATLLSFLFAWGRNLQEATDFFVRFFPMYDKFRTVSSALVIAEFTMPLLAILCLARILREPEALLKARVGLGVALASTAGVCLLLWLAPSVTGNCLSAADTAMLQQLSGIPGGFSTMYASAITSMHHAILSADALRSLLIILLGVGLIWLYTRRSLPAWALTTALAAICLIDLWAIDKRYLNDGNFTDPLTRENSVSQQTNADKQILQDKGDYRVLHLGTDVFNDNSASYWHKSIGGYHPAKLSRYQDLIERHLQKEIPALAGAINMAEGNMAAVKGDSLAPVLNMLNLKYLIFGQGNSAQAIENPYANGNGWFVRGLTFVKGADAEMNGLTGLDTKRAAVADEAFRGALDGSALGEGTVKLTRYEPNELHYDVTSAQGGVVVFSEIYYPGWRATIDGQAADLGRVDYVLRALKVPAGAHKVVLEFRPTSVRLTDTIAFVGIALVLLGFLFALYKQVKR